MEKNPEFCAFTGTHAILKITTNSGKSLSLCDCGHSSCPNPPTRFAPEAASTYPDEICNRLWAMDFARASRAANRENIAP